ncbi:hypothetical protein [Larkinella soli]|uniref:hypothetical protein n=1 Tax=Larkinella soli TaxID=1770527 RepID=UPI000FFC0370|nr:hypothetical protein [Larkinella soli]
MSNFELLQRKAFTNSGTLLLDAPSFRLIDKGVLKAANAKIKTFRKRLKADAPFAEIVGVLSGYDFESTERNVSGYCDTYNRVIAYREGGLPTLYHELAHAIQAEEGKFVAANVELSWWARMEQEAESMAFYLYNLIHRDAPLGVDHFGAYFNTEHLDFLREYMDGYVQDDLFQP